MRTMGLDVGSKTIGVAVSDPLGWTAQGVETIKRTNIEQDLKRLEHLISVYEINTIVVGLPKNMNGSLGPKGEEILTFSDLLQSHFSIKVLTWDERLSTVAAEKTLLEGDVSRKKRKQVIDKLAAVFILQGFLDSK